MPRVLITGTSSGIGSATAIALAKGGWSVVATMRDPTRRDELDKAALAAGVCHDIIVSELDVSNPQSIDRAIAALDLPSKGLDAVVHNAGVAAGGAFEDLDDANIRRIMEVNFFGPLALTRRLLPTFRSQRRGRIVVISSESAFTGQPANSPYCASKWAIEGWAEALTFEVSHFGIDVILVEPGPYRTNIWESSPRIIPKDSAYLPMLRHLDAIVDARVTRFARDPQEVGKVVARALSSARPRFRYPVGPSARLLHFMRGTLPSSLSRKMIGRFLALQRVRW
jgi:NAD(P)-dependent dehydrogenase (short-subunit alcohol dehydrogenase family)